jgi:hypothetical protein
MVDSSCECIGRITLSEQSLPSLDPFKDIGGFCGPDEGLGLPIMVVDELADGFEQFLGIAENTARRRRFSARPRMKRSTILSHEQPEGEVNLEPFPPVNPAVAQLFNEAARKLRAEFEFIHSRNGAIRRHRGER